MPRNLEPSIIALPYELRKGAFIVLPDTSPTGAAGASAGKPQILRFQYNPDTITRSRTGEWQQRKNQKKGAVPTPQQKSNQDSFQGGGLFAKSETIALKLVFDATELLLRQPPDTGAPASDSDAVSLGVLPELAVLEQMSISDPPKDDKQADPNAGDKLNTIHPKELLLVLGSRYFPVIVTSMTITEKRFSPQLIPMRAEVDLQMQVLEATEVAGDPAIKAAFAQLIADRKTRAAMASEDVPVDSLGDLGKSVQNAISAALRRPPGGTP